MLKLWSQFCRQDKHRLWRSGATVSGMAGRLIALTISSVDRQAEVSPSRRSWEKDTWYAGTDFCRKHSAMLIPEILLK